MAPAAGNAVEVALAIDFLTGKRIYSRLYEVVLQLGVEMLLLAGKTEGASEAERIVRAAISSGGAAERFARMVAALGGPADLLDQPSNYLPRAAVVQPVYSTRRGYVVKSIHGRLAFAS